jgi:hypothetical protein
MREATGTKSTVPVAEVEAAVEGAVAVEDRAVEMEEGARIPAMELVGAAVARKAKAEVMALVAPSVVQGVVASNPQAVRVAAVEAVMVATVEMLLGVTLVAGEASVVEGSNQQVLAEVAAEVELVVVVNSH